MRASLLYSGVRLFISSDFHHPFSTVHPLFVPLEKNILFFLWSRVNLFRTLTSNKGNEQNIVLNK